MRFVLPLALFVLALGDGTAPSTTPRPTVAKKTEERPLSAFPAELRPVMKYGVGGGIALWFIGSLVWIIRQRLRQAKTTEEIAAVRQWVKRLIVGVILAVLLLGCGVVCSLITRELIFIWVSAPIAILLPPLLLAWWRKPS